MRKIITFFLFLMLAFVSLSVGVFAENPYHTFGANPMVPGGLTIPAPGSEWQMVPQNIPNVRMWGASGESSVKIFPAGQVVEAHQEQIAGQKMWVATRVKCCGNTVTGLFWPCSQTQAQQQQIVVNVNPMIIFQQPSQPVDKTLYMDARMQGASYSPPQYLNVGTVQKKTVTWSSTTFAPNITNGNINNSSQGGTGNGGAGGQGGAGGAGGDSSSSSSSSSTSGVNSTIIVQDQNINTNNNVNP